MHLGWRVLPEEAINSKLFRLAARSLGVCFFFLLPLSGWTLYAQSAAARKAVTPLPQRNDEEYGRLIHKYLQDSRITTELVDHLPASSTVPTPLKFFGRIPGTPGELTYARDIHRYFEALANSSNRARLWKIGKTEEGRDMVVLAIANERTILNLDRYKAMLAALGDPRKTSEARAANLIKTAKPIYWMASGIHSPETGGPEMLMELAYRLIVEDSPVVQNIRDNTIVFITPVVEVDGREKEVDTYYYGKKTKKPKPPLMYWGKYVQHDNNRDGMGQYLDLTKNITRTLLEWHPTVFHDLHEAQSYLYTSTGSGPYNNSLDPIQINEWWLLAETEVMEMAKRGVPGVWTYGFYDGWVPNYLFWIAVTHNSFGRFYEVQSYGPEIQENLRLGPKITSREWYRPNPPLPSIAWGPRNNTNIQESTLLLALNQVGKDHELYLQNYWLKNKRSIEKGRSGPIYAWWIPRDQSAPNNAAEMVNDLRRQGLEISKPDAAFTAGKYHVSAGDYIIRADQPYRELADMYFGVQNYPVANPRPYDDTGWTMQLMRNVKLEPVTDKTILKVPMTLMAEDAKIGGRVDGGGSILVIDHCADNNLVTLRFRNRGVKMLAAEEDFEAAGHQFHAGSFIIPAPASEELKDSIRNLGLTAVSVAEMPTAKTHDLDVPRIGYIHSWQRTQDEGWVRAAFDYYKIPYTYFADLKLREGHLREKYDVIVYPHVGGTPQSQVDGIPKTGPYPIPYRKTALTPNLGVLDHSDDIRGGMGLDGLSELEKFVEQGGTLITEGSTAALMADYGLTSEVAVEHPDRLAVRGSILRGIFADKKSPIVYGYEGKDLPVYFNQDPVFAAGKAASSRGGGFNYGQNITPNASPVPISPFEGLTDNAALRNKSKETTEESDFAQQRSRASGGVEPVEPRIIMRFPAKTDEMLLSGMLSGGEALASRALVIDAPVGEGHIAMFALRPFWRWQTQGTFFLAFNAILNWNDLDAGKPPEKKPQERATQALF